MHQQIDSSVFLKFTVNAIVSSREPGVCVQQWLDRLILKTDHRILCRRLGCKPKAVDGIQAGLAELVLNQIELDKGGYVAAGETTETSIPGVYAVGDVRTKLLRQVVTAVADGAMAVHMAEEFLAGGA